MNIYEFEVSTDLISVITDTQFSKIENWQHRPLSQIYPTVYIDVAHFSAIDNHIIKKLAVYVILDMNTDIRKEVLSIQIGKNQSSKY